jgi:hypothetical protein
VLDDGFHGFTLQGCNNNAKIKNATAQGEMVTLTLNKEPRGYFQVRYAWGA